MLFRSAFAGWLLESSRAYGIKVVNPGGVEAWKAGWNNIHSLDERVPHLACTPRMILKGLAQTAMDLGLPHPVHIHCNNLGLPGNAATTMATMEALEGRRAHLTHIQFHSYGGEVSDQASFRSEVPVLADWINAHPEVTVDVGQVLFGSTTSMTGDGPLGYFLHQVTGKKWTSADTEMEAGCHGPDRVRTIRPVAVRSRSRRTAGPTKRRAGPRSGPALWWESLETAGTRGSSAEAPSRYRGTRRCFSLSEVCRPRLPDQEVGGPSPLIHGGAVDRRVVQCWRNVFTGPVSGPAARARHGSARRGWSSAGALDRLSDRAGPVRATPP